jgi:ribosomal protein S18 acetylase RimI-like enzyme
MAVTLRWLTRDDVDAVVAASRLFDHAVRPEWARRFLDEATHHLCIAYNDDEPAGMVTGVEMTHPDKGTEMFLYELGVENAFRGQGIGTMLVAALADRARDRGCYGMWVLTDAENEAGLRTYQAGGATERDDEVMLSWVFDPRPEKSTEPDGQV